MCTELRPEAPNAFSPEFLTHLREMPEPFTAAEAEMAGPWKVVPLDDGYGIFREWESPDDGDGPFLMVKDWETALSFLVVMPIFSGEPMFRSGAEAGVGKGIGIDRVGEEVGWCRVFSEDLLFAAHVAESLVRSPRALATLLRNAGPLAMEQVGRILRQEVL